jgi:hypothetical protein
MSYLDEIIAIGKDFRNETIVTNNDSTSLRAIWTYIGNTSVKFKRDVTPCCFSSSSRNKCTIDLKNRLIGYMNPQSENNDKVYSWQQYDISIFCKGSILDPDNVIGGAVITRPVTLKNTSGSIAKVLVVGPSETILNININSVTRGTIVFSPGASSGLISINGVIQLNDGDTISIVSTNTFDGTTEDYMITLSGLAQNVDVWDTQT